MEDRGPRETVRRLLRPAVPEDWQPKNRWVYFRMYQLNLDGQQDRVYKTYWDKYPVHFVESLGGGLYPQPSQKLPSGQPCTPDAPKAGKQA